MQLIIIMTIVIFFILIAWTWQSLGSASKSKKVIFILIGIAIVYIVTLIIFNISKEEISYQNMDSQNAIQNVLVTVFTGLNGIVLIPFIAKTFERVHSQEIEKEKATKRIFIILVAFVIVVIFECDYLKETQEGILKIFQSLG